MNTIADSLVVPNGVDDMVLNEHHIFTGNDGICQTSTPPCSPASLQMLTFPGDTEVDVMQLAVCQRPQEVYCS